MLRRDRLPRKVLVGTAVTGCPVRFRGIRLCERCSCLAKTTHAEVLWGLVQKGGLRAEIPSEGMIQVGDPVARDP